MKRGTPMSNSEARKARQSAEGGVARLADGQVDELVRLTDAIADDEPYALDSLVGTVESWIDATRVTPPGAQVVTASERAAGELVADVDTLAAAIRRTRLAGRGFVTERELAEALVAAGFGRIDAARREALLSAADEADRRTRSIGRQIALAAPHSEKIRLLGVSDGRSGMSDWLRNRAWGLS